MLFGCEIIIPLNKSEKDIISNDLNKKPNINVKGFRSLIQ